MNWYQTLKYAASGDYWVLPTGEVVDCTSDFHAYAGWDHLQQTEPNLDPEEEPRASEDYTPFFKRHWARIASTESVQITANATPQQANAIVDLLFNSDESPSSLQVLLDLPSGYVWVPADQTKMIVSALMGQISPAQIKMRVPQLR